MPPPEDEQGDEFAATGSRSVKVGAAASLGTFSPDDILSQRFKIVRFLEQGGMGEVYEAEDLELGGRVALKTIRPEIATDPRIIQRFKREIALSRRVTHPNVCRIFDLFHHRMEWGTGEAELSFLAMELLPGETLASKLRALGRMTTAEALPIVEQMAAGLDAAHRAGVVHRDFKSANVVLVRADGDGYQVEASDQRVVVTDLGLARSIEGGDGLSTGLGMVGTAAYMAPEQVEGGEVTPAADIYALGVVLYEMVTGVKPFVGDSPLSTAVKRLKERPASPRMHVPDLDPAWDAVILRCLDSVPANRFGSTEEIVRALRGAPVAPIRPENRLRLHRTGTVIGLASLVLLGFVLSYRMFVMRRAETIATPVVSTGAATPVRARRSVALLGFKNLSGRAEQSWLSVALAEMLSTELAAGEKLRTIPGENVARMKIELALADAESLAPDTLARIRANVGTDLVVLGAYLALGDRGGRKIRLDLRVQDAVQGETLVSLTEAGTESELLELVSRTSTRLRQALGISALTESQVVAVRASMPKDPRAAQLYAEGLSKLRHFDALKARDLLEKAVVTDPRFPLGHAALAEAWSELGYDKKAKEGGQRAFDLSGKLSREERLFVEARYHEVSKEWSKATEIYRTLFEFFPDNLEYGLHLANAQEASGKAKVALRTIEALRELPKPVSEDPRIDLTEAWSAYDLGDFSRAETVAARAVALGTRSGADLLVAAARIRQAGTLWALGFAKRAKANYTEAGTICERLGDSRCRVEALKGVAFIAWQSGELAEARRVYEGVIELSRAIGSEGSLANSLVNMGIVVNEQGEHDTARGLFKEARAYYRRIGDEDGVAAGGVGIGLTLGLTGQLAEAEQEFREAVVLFRKVGRSDNEAASLNNVAWILRIRGDLIGAMEAGLEAEAISRRLGHKHILAFNLFCLSEIALDKGDLAAAKAMGEESLALRRGLGQRGKVSESQVALARIAIEEERPSDAELLVQAAINEFRGEGNYDEEAVAHSVLLQALVAQGKLVEAQGAIDRAGFLSRRTQVVFGQLQIAIATARTEALVGRAAKARDELRAALSEAMRRGFFGLELECRLTLGQIEMKLAGAAGRVRLEALQGEAEAKSYGLIARKARAALGAGAQTGTLSEVPRRLASLDAAERENGLLGRLARPGRRGSSRTIRL